MNMIEDLGDRIVLAGASGRSGPKNDQPGGLASDPDESPSADQAQRDLLADEPAPG